MLTARRLAGSFLYRFALCSVALMIWCAIPSMLDAWHSAGGGPAAIPAALLRLGQVIAQISRDIGNSVL